MVAPLMCFFLNRKEWKCQNKNHAHFLLTTYLALNIIAMIYLSNITTMNYMNYEVMRLNHNPEEITVMESFAY